MKKAEREQMLREKLAAMKAFERGAVEDIAGARLGADEKDTVPFYIAGIDEVGRGPLAGPVVTCCVVLPADFDLIGVDDSKKLSEKKRTEMAPLIKEKALAYGFGMADEKVIDRINTLNATKGAMRVACLEADKMLREKTGRGIDCLLIDAVHLEDIPFPQKSIIKGDAKSVSIAAASILAKVTRDAMMVKYAEQYPWYAFEKNKGYGTAAHYDGLRAHGPCPIHRMTFLKNFIK
jgi:ribonuclease HII